MAGTRAKEPTHSGEGHLASNLITFILMFALFLVGVYTLTWLDFDNIWPLFTCLAAFTLAYFIPMIMGRSDSAKELAEGRPGDEGR